MSMQKNAPVGGADGRGAKEPRPPVSEDEAIAEMRAGGYEPEGPYPGRSTTAWQVRCMVCGASRKVRLTEIRGGKRRCSHRSTEILPVEVVQEAVADLRAGGYEPEEPYPGRSTTAWQVRCMVCGTSRKVRLTQVRNGQRRCSHRRPASLPVEVVREELAAAGFDLVDGYEGDAKTVLTLRCQECGEIKRRTLGDVRGGKLCGHREEAKLLTSPEEADKEMREGRYEPLEPYPGTVNGAWLVRCMNPLCRRLRRVSLHKVRQGLRCGHRHNSVEPA